MLPILFMKANVKGHVRGGKWVSPYSTKAPGAKQKVHAPQLGLFGGSKPAASGPKAPPVAYHPSLNDDGQPVAIHAPHKASAEDTWTDADLPATFVPGGPVPAELNGVPVAPWTDHPRTAAEWAQVEGQNSDLDEPPLTLTAGKHAGAGVAVLENDGRIWLVAPTNRFGSYDQTLPKGTADHGVSLQSTAIREAWEEAGLQVAITGHLMDVERSTSVARYYTARRVAGSPADMGWEAQAVVLCPRERLLEFLTSPYDQGLAAALMAQPAARED